MKNLFHITPVNLGKFVVLFPHRGISGGFGYGMNEEAVCFSTSIHNCFESFSQSGFLKEGDREFVYQPVEEILVYHPTSDDEPMLTELEEWGMDLPVELRSENPVKAKRVGYIVVGKVRESTGADWTEDTEHDWTFFREEKG
jgi:hypothetical protein